MCWYKVKPENSVEDCMVLITAKKIRHLPVFEGANFIGLVSIGDVVKSSAAWIQPTLASRRSSNSDC